MGFGGEWLTLVGRGGGGKEMLGVLGWGEMGMGGVGS